MMRTLLRDKPATQYQWEAFDPDDGSVVKRGIVRSDRTKVIKSALDIQSEIENIDNPAQKRHLAPYWRGLKIRVLTRTIPPWTEMEDWEA